MSRPTLDFSRYIPALLTFASNRLSHGASETYRRLFGVGISEWRVLALLASEPDITATRIRQVIGFDKALTSRVVHKLADRKLISMRPDASHGSKSLIRLTPKGERLHDEVLAVVKERERILCDAFSSAEIEILISLLRRLHQQAEAVNAFEPGPLTSRQAPHAGSHIDRRADLPDRGSTQARSSFDC